MSPMSAPPPFPWNRFVIVGIIAVVVVGWHFWQDVRAEGHITGANVLASLLTLGVAAGIGAWVYRRWTRPR